MAAGRAVELDGGATAVRWGRAPTTVVVDVAERLRAGGEDGDVHGFAATAGAGF